MTVLFLDDMDIRHKVFREIASEYDIVVDSAYSAEDAVRKLEKYNYDAACLDHDLADEHYGTGMYGGDRPATGRAVAKHIAAAGKPTMIWIHSYNPDGARAMQETLYAAGGDFEILRSPFGPSSSTMFCRRLQARNGK